MKNYLLSGSIAFDSILLHKGKFETRILPAEVARLNVAFGVDDHKEDFGGCGGNISYNAACLGDTPLVVGTAGRDFKPYALHLEQAGVCIDNIQSAPGYTAHAWVLTDENNNQITAFSKGVMSTLLKPLDSWFDESIALWHLAPEHIGNMSFLAKTAVEKSIPYFLDPGQCLPAFLEAQEGHEFSFRDMVTHASGLFVNEYESALMLEKMGLQLLSDLFSMSKLSFIVQTLGAKGLMLWQRNMSPIFVESCKPLKVTDPTGCGDALRAGFLHGYIRDWDLLDCAKLGSAMGSFAVECSGGQNHKVNITQAMQRTGLVKTD